MAWIYLDLTDSISSPASVETPLPYVSTLVPSLTASRTDTLKLSSYHAWAMGALSRHPFGTTSRPYAETTSTCQSTSSLEAFPAKTSALQVLEQAWKESEAAFFMKSFVWPKKSSPDSYSLKTSPQSERGDWTELSKNLPESGMTLGGRCYPLKKSELLISESAGSVLPPDGKPWATPIGSGTNRNLEAWNRKAERENRGRPHDLTTQVKLWPTPRANKPEGYSSPNYSPTLVIAVTGEAKPIGGKLNPQWVEWLMGYPAEWTVLSDLGMQWSLSKPKQRSKS